MKYKEIISTVRNHFDSPISDDNRLSERWVFFVIDKLRAAILYEDLKMRKPINEHNKQTISVPFVETDENYCDCDGDNKSICKVLRSRCAIPKIIDNTIFDISSSSGMKQFEIIDASALKYKKASRMQANQSKIYVFFRTLSDGQYMYIANSSFIDKALLVALFEEPQKAKESNCCENELPSCDPLDDEFYLDDRLIPRLTDMAIKYFATAMGRSDILNNDLSDIDISNLVQQKK